MILIRLQATDSKYADMVSSEITPERLPLEMPQLMAHQLATWHALQDDAIDIVINEAMTGDGKTLAAQLHTLLTPDAPAVFMYPTNELIRDQSSGLLDRLAIWPRDGLTLKILNAAELDKLETNMSLKRADAIKIPLERDFVLTNPDVFHLLMQFQYVRFGTAQDHLLSQVAGRFRLFVFDEFHLFGTPQVSAAMIAMLLLHAVSRNKPRFLFLSATPQSFLQLLAEQTGLSVRTIHGQYLHGEETSPAGYRRILHPANLHLWNGNIETWMELHLDDVIRRFFIEQRPYGAQGVVVVNSVVTAHRLYASIRDLLTEDDITVALNTGLTGYEERAASRGADLIIGTSTIDVGVDFQINLLIFESADAASHMQRLGRLGRHAEDHMGRPFQHYEVHALLPSWVIASVEAALSGEDNVNRQRYGQIIEDAFTPTNTFNGYTQDWAGLQAAHVLATLEDIKIRDTYRPIIDELEPLYSRLFKPYFRKQYFKMAKDKNERPLVVEAKSFRGGSPFTAIVVDQTRQHNTITTYNLLSLLRHGDLEALNLEGVLANSDNRRSLERHRPLAAYRLHAWLPQSRRLSFRLDRRIDDWAASRFGQARAQKGFQIEAEGVPRLYEINRDLAKTPLVVTLIRGLQPDELRRRLRLGWRLALYVFESEDNITGCVAFSRDALLLHSALKRSSVNPGGSQSLIF
jgi:CRISPR-associated endonuclease/helicase Cas3